MTLRNIPTDAEIAAFADGEMPPEDAAALVMALADSPDGQARLDRVMLLNQMLGRAYEAPLSEPIPPAIHRVLEPAAPPRPAAEPVTAAPEPEVFTRPEPAEAATILPFRPRGSAARKLMPLAGLAVAATIAAAFVMPSIRQQGGTEVALGEMGSHTELANALNTLPSGASARLGNSTIHIVASYPTSAGMCREFEHGAGDAVTGVALACGLHSDWKVVALATVGGDMAPGDAGFRPASGAEGGDPISQQLDRVGAGAAMSVDEEARILGTN